MLLCKSGNFNTLTANIQSIPSAFVNAFVGTEECVDFIEAVGIDGVVDWSCTGNDPETGLSLLNYLDCGSGPGVGITCATPLFNYTGPAITDCAGKNLEYCFFAPATECDPARMITGSVVLYPEITNPRISTSCSADGSTVTMTANYDGLCSLDFLWSTGATTQSIDVPNDCNTYSVEMFFTGQSGCSPIMASAVSSCFSITCPSTDGGSLSCGAMPPTPATTEAEFEALPGTPDISGACTGVLILSTDEETCQGEDYVLLRTYTVIDDANNDGMLTIGETNEVCTISYNYNIEDPVITCPPNQNIDCASNISAGVPTIATSCAIASSFITEGPTLASGMANCNGAVYELLYIATDDCGRKDSCTQLFTIQNSQPVITCPADALVSCESDISASVPTIMVSCTLGSSYVTEGPTLKSGVANCDGATYEMLYIVTDACGGKDSCAQLFTIQNDKPIITCPVDQNVVCSNDIVIGMPAVTTACGLSSTITSSGPTLISGEAECLGSIYEVIYIAEDDCGRSDTCSQKFTIANSGTSIICPPNQNVTCSGDIEAGVPTINTFCSLGSSLEVEGPTLVSGQQDCSGAIYELLYIAIDDCGGRDSCIQQFTIQNSAPTITSCPSPKTVSCSSEIISEVDMVLFTTSCSLGATVIARPITPNLTNSACGQTTGDVYSITYVVTDACGQQDSCIQEFTVQSDEVEIVCPIGFTIKGCAADIPAPDVSLVTATHSCTNVTVSWVGDITSGSGCIGDSLVVLRTYRATNDCGDFKDCIQTIKVVDSENPTISLDMGTVMVSCAEEAILPMVTTSDNCTALGDLTIDFTQDTTFSKCAGDYSILRKWIVTDLCGNKDSTQQEVIIFDNDGPVIVEGPEDLTLSCDETIPDPLTPVFEDGCTGVDISFDQVMVSEFVITGTCANDFKIIRTWTAQDSCGNEVSVSQNISVIDRTEPTIICPADTLINGCIADVPSPNINLVTAFDNCSSVTITHIADNIAGSGCPGDTLVIQRVYRATDECGNYLECSQNIKVVDNINPEISLCVNDIVVVGCDETAAPAVDLSQVAAFDGCSDVVISHVGDVSSGTICIGDTLIITRTYRATDLCGNFSECDQLIKIIDNVSLVITCPPQSTVFLNEMCSYDLSVVPAATATDNCNSAADIAITFSDDLSGLTNCSGSGNIVRTWYATDLCGNVDSCLQTIAIVDAITPTISCPASDTLYMSSNCDYDLSGILTPNVTDNCSTSADIKISFTDDVSGLTECSMTGDIIRTWIAEDLCGNRDSCMQTITILDTISPIITCPISVDIFKNDACMFDLSGLIEPVTTDNCSNTSDIVLTFTDDQSGLTGCGGTGVIIRTWIAEDLCGNISTCNQTINILDQNLPVIICSADKEVTCLSAIASETPTVTTSCNVSFSVATSEPLLIFGQPDCPGAKYQITYTVTDECGKIDSCSQLFTIANEALSITCPANEIVICEIGIEPSVPVIQTSCSLGSTYTSEGPILVSGTPNCNGAVYEIKYIAVDECGRKDSCVQRFTIENVAPMITDCPPARIVTCSDDIMAEVGLLGYNNSCDIDGEVMVGMVVPDTNNSACGESTGDKYYITYTVTDICGRMGQCTQEFTISSPDVGILCVPDLVVQGCDETDIPAPDISLITGAHTCSNVTVTWEGDSSSGIGCIGDTLVISRTYRATNDCGFFAECIQRIKVIDTESPTISVDAPVVLVSCTEEAPVPVLTIADNCTPIGDLLVDFSQDTTLSKCSGDFSIVRKWVVTDLCGNKDSTQQELVVFDDDGPVIIEGPADLSLSCEEPIPSPDDPLFMDGCSDVDISFEQVIASDLVITGSCDNDYTIVRTWTATDSCGNQISVSQNIIVTDRVEPTITCPSDSIISGCLADLPLPDVNKVVAFDNCGDVVVTHISDQMIGAGCQGDTLVINRIYRATDECGNFAECLRTFKIVDTGTPDILFCPSDTLIIGCGAAAIPDINLTAVIAADECSAVTISHTGDEINGVGCVSDTLIVSRTYRATDACGNFTECIQLIKIIDTISPVITCPMDIELMTDGNCDYDLSLVPSPIVSDDCTMPSQLSVTFDDDLTGLTACSGTGTIIRTWTVTDQCGNSSQCEQNIFVVDSIAPSITCSRDTTLYFSATCTYDLSGIALPQISDNCSEATELDITFSDDLTGLNQCSGSGVIRRTWNLADACGNTNSCIQNIFIRDTISPTIVCAPNQSIYMDPSCGYDLSVILPPTVLDNCSVSSSIAVTYIDNFDGLSECSGTGDIIRTWIARDLCSNESTCQQVISVFDTIKPNIVCPTSATLYLDSNCSYDLNLLDDPTYDDNCTAFGLLKVEKIDDLSGLTECNGTGSIIRTWKVEDLCGNINQCTQVIEILDTISPVLTGGTNKVVSCSDDIYQEFIDWINDHAGSSALDNCSDINWATVPATPILSDPTSSTCVTFVASDDCGNKSSFQKCFNVNCATIQKSLVSSEDRDLSMDISVGDILNYSVEYVNTGSTVLNNVVVTDNLITPSDISCLSIAPGESCVLTGIIIVDAQDLDLGEIVNTASVISDEFEELVDSVSISLSTPSITFVKNDPILYADIDNSGDISVGDTLQYVLIATNNGVANLTNVEINDNRTGDQKICPLLQPNEQCILEALYVVTSDDVEEGSITNVGTVNSIQTDVINDTVITLVAQPRIELDKLFPINSDFDNSLDISLGDTLTYTIIATNTGSSNLTNVTITDPLITTIGGNAPCLLLQPTEQCSLIGQYIITDSDVLLGVVNEITNVAVVTTDQTSDVVDSVTIEVPNPSIILTKEPGVLTQDNDNSNDVSVGDVLTYTITMTNNGNANFSESRIEDPLLTPGFLDCGFLSPGAQCMLVGTITVTDDHVRSGSLTNGSLGTASPPPTMDSDSSTIIFPQPSHSFVKNSPVLLEDKDASMDISRGDIVQYTLVVTNNGSANLTNVKIEDPLISPSLKICDFVAPGAQCILTGIYEVQPSDLGTTLKNEASSSSDQTDMIVDSSTVIIPEPKLEFEKSIGVLANDFDGDNQITANDSVEYTFEVRNTGTANINGIQLNDELIYMSSSECSFLSANMSCFITAKYAVTQEDMDRGFIKNVAHISSTQLDDKTDSSTTVLPFLPLIELTKNVSDPSVEMGASSLFTDQGDAINYTFVVKNTGTVTINQIQISDDGPEILGQQGSNPLSAITCDKNVLAPNDSATCTAIYILSNDDLLRGVGVVNGVSNNAKAQGVDPRMDPLMTNMDTAMTTIQEYPAIELKKEALPLEDTNGDGIIWAGDIVKYRFTIDNVGNTQLDNISITDLKITDPIDCDASILLPGQSTVCTGTYLLTEAEVEDLIVENTATVQGVSPVSTLASDISDDPSDPTTNSIDPTIIKIPCPSVVCVGSYNMSIPSSGVLTLSAESLGLVSGFILELTDENGRVIADNTLTCDHIGENITYTLRHPCRSNGCWGVINLESKNLPDPIYSSQNYMCGQSPEPLLTIEEVRDSVISNGCYLEIDNLTEQYELSGDVCVGTVQIRNVVGQYFIHGVKNTLLLSSDTLIEMPLEKNMINWPDMEVMLDCQEVEDSYPSIELLIELKGISSVVPHINKGERIDSTLMTVAIDKDSLREEKVELQPGVWSIVQVVDKYQLDSSYYLRDTTQILIPITKEGTCNLTAKCTDVAYANCLGENKKIFREWSIIDWCTDELLTYQQWVNITSTEGPQVDLLSSNEVAIRPWVCTAEYTINAEFSTTCSDLDNVYWSSSAGTLSEGKIKDLRVEDSPIQLIVRALDECGSVANDTFYIDVIDNLAPTAIAIDTLHASLAFRENSNVTKVLASSINNGSNDGNCGIVDYCVLRSEELSKPIIRNGVHLTDIQGRLMYEPFGCSPSLSHDYLSIEGEKEEILYVVCSDFVQFCCEDEGANSVALIVRDDSDYSQNSIGWSTVVVEDKIRPSIHCDTLYVNCIDEVDRSFLDDLQSLVFGCQTPELTYSDVVDVDGCGVGSISREYFINEELQCTQAIIIEGESQFDPSSIKWPLSYTGESISATSIDCDGVEGTESIVLPAPFTCSYSEVEFPTWCNSSCGMIDVGYEDLETIVTNSCKRIIRKWTVIDWCLYNGEDLDQTIDPSRAVVDLTENTCRSCSFDETRYIQLVDPELDGYYIYEQTIEIVDEDVPQIFSQDTGVVQIINGATHKLDSFEACSGSSFVSAQAVDYCDGTLQTSNLDWTVGVYTDGRMIETLKLVGDSVVFELPEGSINDSYVITWQVTDGCGNVAVDQTTIIYEDHKEPTPVCIPEVTTAVMPTSGKISIWAKDFDNGSFDNCSEVELLFFDSIKDDYVPYIEFDCLDLLQNNFEIALDLYVFDDAANSDYCTVMYVVQDNLGVCNTSNMANLSGEVFTASGDMIEEVKVAMRDQERITEKDGQYAFMSNPMYESYTIAASKGGDHMNGVTALDLVLIQKHILGLQKIVAEDKRVAADINNDGEISAIDLVMLRRLILNQDDHFPDQRSWRFIAAQEFEVGRVGPLWPYKEYQYIDTLIYHQFNLDFLGIKVGDVSGDAVLKNRNKSRPTRMLNIDLTKVENVQNKLRIPIYVDQAQTMEAIQLTLHHDGLILESIESGQIEITKNNYFKKSDANTTLAWHSQYSKKIDVENPLFYIVVAEKIGYEGLKISSEIVEALIYSEMKEYYIESRTLEKNKFVLYQNTPNPFSDKTMISFDLPDDDVISLTIYDLIGRFVYTKSLDLKAGHHSIQLSKKEIDASGVLYYEVKGTNYRGLQKMMIID